MRNTFQIQILFPLLLFLLYSCSTEESIVNEDILFNSSWSFTIVQDEHSGIDQLIADKALEWEQVNLPHTPRIEPLLVNNQWQGICWYKKAFSYEEAWKDKEIFLRFEAAMNTADLWLNGKKLGRHEGGYLPFTFRLNEFLNDSMNILYIRLDNNDNPVTGPKPLNILDFNTYGGIYRDVKLIVENQIFISDEQWASKKAGGGIFVSYPAIDKEFAQIAIKTHLVNSSAKSEKLKIIYELVKEGKIVATSNMKVKLNKQSDKHISGQLEVANPELWSPQSPSLYTLTVRVTGRKNWDVVSEKIGIRSFELKDNKLYINGEETFLRGVNRHQEYPYVGYALSNNANYRDAYKIKMAGFDYVRLSHYPQSPSFMDACDELGLVCIDAILGWQYFNNDPAFAEHVKGTVNDLIRRDRNHPSVLAWEVSLNETRMSEEFIDSLINRAKEEFPDSICYTAGWRPYGYDIFLEARQHRLRHKAHYPEKPYVVSEYGDWEYYAQNAGFQQDNWEDLLQEERTSRQLIEFGEKRLLQQALNIQEAHNDNFNTPAFADGYWVMYDYNRGYDNALEASGIMSIFREPKFSYYFFQSQRSPDEMVIGKKWGPVLHIASFLENPYMDNIKVYSNAEEVELYINGQSIGKKSPSFDQPGNHLKHPPFIFNNPGIRIDSMRAVAYINNEKVSQDILISPGEPTHIHLELDLSGKKNEAACNDIVFVHASLRDQNGELVTEQTGNMLFGVEGDAQIIGLAAPELRSGHASILVKAGENAGKIQVSAYFKDLGSVLNIDIKK